MAKLKKFECEHCKEPFLSPYKKKFCSTPCLKKGRKKPEETLNGFIINKLLKSSNSIWKDKNASLREMGFAKKLIKKYPLKAFWEALPPKFDADSLTWYIAPRGWAYLKIEYAKFCLDLPPPIRHNVPDVKVGDDKVISKKSTNIKDFIKYGSKKENN
ncbi:hypothetical protein CMI37_13400 [Candidatus Pacearchaeota archaeon]|nr:hypothetical protein [Candidatus Pacearchaeota archaeon]|tara:strand:+ start:5530 stop:6003 length:474 start_codon:yes stop_codon:yes gene_type:complete